MMLYHYTAFLSRLRAHIPLMTPFPWAWFFPHLEVPHIERKVESIGQLLAKAILFSFFLRFFSGGSLCVCVCVTAVEEGKKKIALSGVEFISYAEQFGKSEEAAVDKFSLSNLRRNFCPLLESWERLLFGIPGHTKLAPKYLNCCKRIDFYFSFQMAASHRFFWVFYSGKLQFGGTDFIIPRISSQKIHLMHIEWRIKVDRWKSLQIIGVKKQIR